jgi:hypothetical protein
MSFPYSLFVLLFVHRRHVCMRLAVMAGSLRVANFNKGGKDRKCQVQDARIFPPALLLIQNCIPGPSIAISHAPLRKSRAKFGPMPAVPGGIEMGMA